jgi:hypothetical protein
MGGVPAAQSHRLCYEWYIQWEDSDVVYRRCPSRNHSISKVGGLLDEIACFKLHAGTVRIHANSVDVLVLLQTVILTIHFQDEPSSVAIRPG